MTVPPDDAGQTLPGDAGSEAHPRPPADAGDAGRRLGRATAVPLVRVVVLLALAAFIGGAAVYAWPDDDDPPGSGSVDVGFYRDMTVHHDQGVAMATIERANGANPTVRGFAEEIVMAQRWELGRMYQRLVEWGAALERPRTVMAWMGMGMPTGSMPGLASDESMAELRRARGAAADALFLELMAEHHRGAVHMARYAAEHAESEDVRGLAEVMARNQAVEINEFIDTARRIGLDVDIEPEPVS